MKKYYPLLVILLLTLQASAQIVKRPAGTTSASLGFLEYLPPTYGTQPEKKYPVIISFHGIGENGAGSAESLESLVSTGIFRLIKGNQWPVRNSSGELPSSEFIVLSPQNTTAACITSNSINKFIDDAVSMYRIDVKRIYLTGYSCGAIGLWDFIVSNSSNKAAAIIPIAGDGSTNVCNYKGAVWAFHGDADQTVDVSGSINGINALNNCNPSRDAEAKLTTYPNVGHNSWDRTYNLTGYTGISIYDWLLQFRLPDDGSQKFPQTISFLPILDKYYDEPYGVMALTTSSLPISFEVVSGPATLDGNLVNFTGVGQVTIKASQAGDETYLPAPDVYQSFNILKGRQSIIFNPINNMNTNDAPFNLQAFTSSKLPVTFSTPPVSPPLIALNGSTVTLMSSGFVSITASQPGNDLYEAATPVTQTFTITNSSQCFAYSVKEFKQGKTKKGGAIETRRSNPQLALGGPQDNDTYNFVALGFGGSITLELQAPLYNTNGFDPDFILVETSFGRADEKCFAGGNTFNYPETVVIEVSDGTKWRSLPDSYCRTSFIDISSVIDAAFPSVKLIRIKDFSNKEQFDDAADGFDVDGLIVCPEEVRKAFTQYTNGRSASSRLMWDPDFINRAPNEAADELAGLKAYPNPVKGGAVSISYYSVCDQQVQIHVYDAKGVRKYDGAEYAKEGENTHEVDVTTLTNGLYIVRVLTKGKLLAEKFIRE